MVGPTGVEQSIAAIIPKIAHTVEMIAEHITTPLKVRATRIAERAGKISSAEMRREPTRFIPKTMITAVITATKRLYNEAFIPLAFAKFSSKVIENMRL